MTTNDPSAADPPRAQVVPCSANEEARKEVARRLVADFAADAHERLKHQQQISVNVIRSLMTVNGGGIVGLLTFLGNSERTFDEGNLKAGFLSFAVGLSLALLSNFGAWLTEGYYKDFSQSHSFNHQDALEGKAMQFLKEAEQEAARGNKWLGATILVLLGSLLAFGVGAYFAANGIL